MGYLRFASCLMAACLLVNPVARATATLRQDAVQPQTEVLHRPLDQILDLNVRDGLVYYRALRSERGRLDRYIASLNVPAATYDGWSTERRMAFWLNAYNAFVLQTVIEQLPDPGIEQELSGEQHPAGAGRIRANQAPRCRTERHAR